MHAIPPAFLASAVAAPVTTPQVADAGPALPAFLAGGLIPMDPPFARLDATPPAFLTAGAAPQAAAATSAPAAQAAANDAPLSAICGQTAEGVNALGRFHFFMGSARLSAEARRAIPDVAARLRQCPNLRVEVGGHADNVGDPKANMELARRRATAVIQALEARGVDGRRLYWRAYGSSAPIASNDTPEGRALNRRIEVMVR
jgi:OOP family OmpA-OmpF porin